MWRGFNVKLRSLQFIFSQDSLFFSVLFFCTSMLFTHAAISLITSHISEPRMVGERMSLNKRPPLMFS